MCASTYSARWRPLTRGERNGVRDALRGRGLHLTTQREAISEAIFGCPGHICAEHILGFLSHRRPNLHVNKTTVYRALGLFVDLNLISEHKLGDGPAQYEPATRGRHSHLVCRQCGRAQDIGSDLVAALETGVRDRYGFEAELESHPIFGICADCMTPLNV